MTEDLNRRSYKHVTLGDKWDVVVIGSGIGGLTAAVLLSVHGGKRVLVLERHYAMGGFTHTFRRPGYEWDVGLHYIGEVQDATSRVRRAFDLPKLFVKLQKYFLRQLFGAFPIAQKAQRQAEDERLVVCQDFFEIQAGETECHIRYYG